MIGKRIGYKRVSTVDQNPERQLEGVSVDKIFIDYCTGRTIDRPEFNKMIEYAREDDLIIVHSMDRLSRNTQGLRHIIDDLTTRNIQIQFMKENLIFNGNDSAISNLLLSLLGAVAEFEHALIRERQLEGIAIAKRAGKYKGRKRIIDAEKLEQIRTLMLTRKTKNQIAREVGVSRFTLYRALLTLQVQKEE